MAYARALRGGADDEGETGHDAIALERLFSGGASDADGGAADDGPLRALGEVLAGTPDRARADTRTERRGRRLAAGVVLYTTALVVVVVWATLASACDLSGVPALSTGRTLDAGVADARAMLDAATHPSVVRMQAEVRGGNATGRRVVFTIVRLESTPDGGVGLWSPDGDLLVVGNRSHWALWDVTGGEAWASEPPGGVLASARAAFGTQRGLRDPTRTIATVALTFESVVAM